MALFYTTPETIGQPEDIGLIIEALRNPKPWVQPAEEYLSKIADLNERIAELEERDRTLSALEAAGVDNWEGYSEAMRSLSDGEDED